jgi:hypothetical protein
MKASPTAGYSYAKDKITLAISSLPCNFMQEHSALLLALCDRQQSAKCSSEDSRDGMAYFLLGLNLFYASL